METRKLDPPLKYSGGKGYMAKHIQALAPPHIHRVIPFAGGLGEYWSWNAEGVSEVINDIDGDLMNFYRVLQDEKLFKEFVFKSQLAPFSKPLWEFSRHIYQDKDYWRKLSDVSRAYHFFLMIRQSRAGGQKCFATLSKNRVRRGMNEQVSAWLTAVEGLPEAHARIQRAVVLQEDAIGVIEREDGPNTLFYCDLPYYPTTRTSKHLYNYEMSVADHARFLRCVKNIRGKMMISNYHNPMYDKTLAKWGWVYRDFDLPNHMAGGETKRRMTEVVWANYRLPVVAA